MAIPKMKVSDKKLTIKELRTFMNTHGFSEREFADFLGVTRQGINLWLLGSRDISLTISRLIRLLAKYPKLIKEF